MSYILVFLYPALSTYTRVCVCVCLGRVVDDSDEHTASVLRDSAGSTLTMIRRDILNSVDDGNAIQIRKTST